MNDDLIRDEIAYLLAKPAHSAEMLGDCDALQCVELSTVIRLLTARPGEYGSACDEFRDELAKVLTGYPHAVELAQRSLDARDEYAHRAGRAA